MLDTTLTTAKTSKHSMQIQRIPFNDIPQLSSRDKAYANEDPQMRPFYKYDVTLNAFEKVIADKQKDTINRKVLVKVLEEQYAKYKTSKKVKDNIAALGDDNTFTIITAHQPSLFTGPLYYILKIVSCINLAKELNTQYPDYRFIPVFVTGGEDHDFEEVNHTHLFGKTITWNNDENGSVGMMKTASMADALTQLKDILGNHSENAQYLAELMETAHTKHKKYADATIHVVNELFKEDGLVVAGMNHKDLKREFIPIIKEEIFEQASKKLIEAETRKLEKAGFGGQAYPREINFFYLRDQIRERIIEEDGRFKVLNTDYNFSRKELEVEIETHPEFFSPNVIMRPLYQETIFPNLAYIGGGGELAYWMERQPQFKHFGLNYPMLVRRNSALWVDKGNAKKLKKLNLSIEDIFTDTEILIKQYVKANTENEISLKREQQEVREIFKKIHTKAKEIDPTLAKTVKAEEQKQVNAISALEAKIMRAEKQQHDIAINQIRTLKDKLCPNNGLQERYDNFMNLYMRYGKDFFKVLKAELNPLEDGFIVIVDA